jgi:hypothetical protein
LSAPTRRWHDAPGLTTDSHGRAADDRFPRYHESARLPAWPGVFLNIEQETEAMSKSYHRRAVLAGIAATPALAAAPALAGRAAGDPILAAIGAHRRLDDEQYRVWGRLQETEGPDEEALKAEHNRLCEAADEARLALTKIRPTTAAGAGALVAYVRDDLEDGDMEWHLPTLANAANALRGMGDEQLRTVVQVDADPIFALIEQHRAADAHWDTLHEEDDETTFNAAGAAACALADTLGRTPPTTPAGILAILRYRREHDVAYPGYHLFIPQDSEGENAERGRLMNNWLATLEKSITAIAGEVVS